MGVARAGDRSVRVRVARREARRERKGGTTGRREHDGRDDADDGDALEAGAEQSW